MNGHKKALLIEAVKSRPVLWNVNDETYQKNRNKCHIWSDIERSLQINEPLYSGLKAKECWRYLRKKYFEEKIRLAGNPQSTPSFTLYSQLSFLDSTTSNRLDCSRNTIEQSSSDVGGANNQWASSITADMKPKSSFAAGDNVINFEAVSTEPIIPKLLVLATQQLTQNAQYPYPSPSVSFDEMTDSLMRSAQALERMSDLFRKLNADRNFLFFVGVLEELNALPPLQQEQLKLSIQKTISDLKDQLLSSNGIIPSLNT
ncbi:hypothetical protein QR680_001481 [Steinernema hermaphroditum]|uniref:MADF domain-containing protein n=1 Tax=Steinernema hermaphroditum TaxID=289476 RepID=A0AA39GYI8_9BILA|nr:hypothetical protein QR680_001481 [Steinernema hermaphroditum]